MPRLLTIMNKRQVLANLNQLAYDLEEKGFYKEAESITNYMIKIAEGFVGHPIGAPDKSLELAETEEKLQDWNQRYQQGGEPQRDVMHETKAEWNKKVDRNFIQSLFFVHWGDAQNTDKRLKLPNVEISCRGYKNPPFKQSWPGNCGIMLKGRVTLAGNSDLRSDAWIGWEEDSDLNGPRWSFNMDLILDENDFREDKTNGNEFLLVNFKPVAVIKGNPEYYKGREGNMTPEELAAKHNLPLLDENGNEIS